MILTRLPVISVRCHALPWPADPGKESMPRVAIEATLRLPLGPVRFTTTHLEYYSARQRMAQVERLRELHVEACGHARTKASSNYRSGPFEPFERPVAAILTGDFNMKADDAACVKLREPFEGEVPRLVDAWAHVYPGVKHPPTFCVHGTGHSKAPYCCDFVFVTENLAPRLKSVRVDVHTQDSDHQPVAVELG